METQAVETGLELEVLHSLHGDKKRKFDTRTETGRKETQAAITRMIREGTAIYLERGKDKDGRDKAYRVTGYDPAKDRLLVRIEQRDNKTVAAKAAKGRKTAVAPTRGG